MLLFLLVIILIIMGYLLMNFAKKDFTEYVGFISIIIGTMGLILLIFF